MLLLTSILERVLDSLEKCLVRDVNDCFVTLLVFNRAAYAKDHQPCIIFMDEIDAIGKRERERGTEGETEDMLFLLFLHQVVRGFLRALLLIVRYNGH